MRVNDIRSQFLDYFVQHTHQLVSSSSLVPNNDPTLMFTAAGMVQFKNVFTGLEQRPYTRAVSSQKCVRAGGKHNDLENVGYTARHHTFFEMLGNFSFGDYFKEEAIYYAWTLITKEFSLPRDRLLITVYHEDDEAFDLWKKIAGLPDHKILRIATADNFWSMGDTGPCGPCSEIFYDHGESIPGGPPGSPDEDGDRFVEIWNLVFMQYEQQADGTRINLPKPSIDTGMGLERLSAVMQGVHDNYDIDLFKRLIRASEDFSGVKSAGDFKFSHRVIADHLRSCSFLIADGITPSNEGRGYVLRRIMRRAMRHVHILGQKQPMMYKLIPSLVDEMGAAYPELKRAETLITETMKLEEERFQQTLDRGLKLLEQESHNLSSGQKLSGDVAFKLYDTYGFPLDLTQDILRKDNKDVDLEGFQAAMDRQKATARAAWVGSGDVADDKLWFDIADQYGASEFLGYETHVAEAVIQAIVKDDHCVNYITAGEKAQIIVNQTPFYAESGGQVGDTGSMVSADLSAFKVSDTRKKTGHVFSHIGSVQAGTLKVGDVVHLTVDNQRRTNLRAHHSATHLLHATLRELLGASVTQKGSLVAPDRLRFDFSFNRALSLDEIKQIEDHVNYRIRKNDIVMTQLMSPEIAQEKGAMALFGEKYGEEVRVVSMGGLNDEQKVPYSIELCGGTHVQRTGDIGYFKILSDNSISAGIRRIEAVVGEAAENYMRQRDEILSIASDVLKVNPPQLAERLETLLQERKKLEQDLKKAKQALASSSGSKSTTVETINGVQYTHRHLEDVPAKDLKPIADQLKTDIGSGVVMITAVNDGRVSIVVGVTADLTDKYSAVDLVRIAAEQVGGQGGGGRPDMAQAGGSNPAGIIQADTMVRNAI